MDWIIVMFGSIVFTIITVIVVLSHDVSPYREPDEEWNEDARTTVESTLAIALSGLRHDYSEERYISAIQLTHETTDRFVNAHSGLRHAISYWCREYREEIIPQIKKEAEK